MATRAFAFMLSPHRKNTGLKHKVRTVLLARATKRRTQSLSSKLFWYGDHEIDPLDWHRRYVGFIGLNLPLDETMVMAQAASEGEIASTLAYKVKGMDKHPDGREDPSESTFKDELGEESLQMMDEVMRRWLPPVVLRRLGVLLV